GEEGVDVDADGVGAEGGHEAEVADGAVAVVEDSLAGEGGEGGIGRGGDVEGAGVGEGGAVLGGVVPLFVNGEGAEGGLFVGGEGRGLGGGVPMAGVVAGDGAGLD